MNMWKGGGKWFMSRYSINIIVDDVRDRPGTLLKRAVVNVSMLEGVTVVDQICRPYIRGHKHEPYTPADELTKPLRAYNAEMLARNKAERTLLVCEKCEEINCIGCEYNRSRPDGN